MMRLPLNSACLASAALLVLAAGAGAVFADYRHEQAKNRHQAEIITGGDADRGRSAFVEKGCGGCHAIRGVPQANGLVGPRLDDIGARAVIAGRLENSPATLIAWISDPQAVDPGNAMPLLPMTPQESRDLAAFLYSR